MLLLLGLRHGSGRFDLSDLYNWCLWQRGSATRCPVDTGRKPEATLWISARHEQNQIHTRRVGFSALFTRQPTSRNACCQRLMTLGTLYLTPGSYWLQCTCMPSRSADVQLQMTTVAQKRDHDPRSRCAEQALSCHALRSGTDDDGRKWVHPVTQKHKKTEDGRIPVSFSLPSFLFS